MILSDDEAPAQADRREVTQQEDVVLRRAAMRSAKVIHEPAQAIPAEWREAVKVALEQLERWNAGGGVKPGYEFIDAAIASIRKTLGEA